jgi:hypothetical protein
MSYNKTSVEAEYTPNDPTLGDPDSYQAGGSCDACSCT